MYFRNDPVGRYASRRHERTERARLLARLADIELQHGHHGAAEFLSHRAEAIRPIGDDHQAHSVSATPSFVFNRTRIQPGVEQLYPSGPLVFAEMLAEVAARFPGVPTMMPTILSMLDEYLTGAILAEVAP